MKQDQILIQNIRETYENYIDKFDKYDNAGDQIMALKIENDYENIMKTQYGLNTEQILAIEEEIEKDIGIFITSNSNKKNLENAIAKAILKKRQHPDNTTKVASPCLVV